MSLLRVCELFSSLQGEGASLGQPAVFLRLGDCNLNCNFCDTRYSWDWQNYARREELTERDVGELAAAIRESAPRRLVVTGGEPLLQCAGLEELLQELPDHLVEIETNGTVQPSPWLLERVTQWNVSPKLSNSGVREFLRLKPEVLTQFVATGRAWLKCVIGEASHLHELAELVQLTQWPSARVMVMPQAQSVEELHARSAWLADAAMRAGFGFSTRLHLLLWGNQRGR